MRDAFHEDLDSISDQLVEMTRLAGSAMNRATTALLDADLHLAESVIAADEQIDGLRKELDDRSIDLLARQQPVATDLRMVVTSMRMSADLERMGDLARHVAKVARLRYPQSAIPAEARATVLQIFRIAGIGSALSVPRKHEPLSQSAMNSVGSQTRRIWPNASADCGHSTNTGGLLVPRSQ